MGNSSGRFDINTTIGVPDALTGERRKQMMALSEKARKTMPPAFKNEAQEGPVESEEGDRAVEIGAAAVARSYRVGGGGLLGLFSSSGYPPRRQLEEELGGLEGFFTLFGCHYCRMFADPRMRVLFDSRHADTNVSALEHGKRVGASLLDRWYGTRLFRQLGRGSAFFAVTPTHQRAKSCPMRPRGHRRAQRFTTTQRNAWIGHVCCAAEEVGASEDFRTRLGDWLAANIAVYAPWLDEETGQLVD